MYNSTPHTTTGVAPFLLMFGRILRDKIPSVVGATGQLTEEIRDRDWSSKLQAAELTDQRRKAKESTIKIGDVIAKRTMKDHKLSSNFGSELFDVIKRSGSDVEIRSISSGKTYNRNVSHLKQIVLQTQEKVVADPENQTENAVYDEVDVIPVISQESADQKTNERSRERRDPKPPKYLKDYVRKVDYDSD